MQSGSGKRVLVLGAGMSGLAAAFTLAQKGIDVTVLEARGRVGGKVFTMRDGLETGLHAEAGALLIPGTHARTLFYVDMLGLELCNMSLYGPPAIYLQGVLVPNPGKASAKWPVKLKKAEQKLGAFGMWEKYFASFADEVGDPKLPTWPSKKIARYDQKTLAEFLRERGASDGALEIMCLGPNGAWGDGFAVGSALMWLRDLAMSPESLIWWAMLPVATPANALIAQEQRTVVDPQPDGLYFLKNGTDGLPNKLSQRPELADRIKTDSPVVAIQADEDSITAICETAAGTQRYTADYCICTIPFSVLRGMDVLMPLTRPKRRAIDQLQYTSLTRTWIQTKSPTWNEQGLPGLTFTDLSVMFVAAANQYQNTTKGLLDVYVTGRNARMLMAKDRDDRITRTLEGLDEICPGLSTGFEAAVSHCWDEDPWARGAYPWGQPGDVTTLYPQVAPPEGRLHFAGEHASLIPGWMDGAISSGERAANEIIAALAGSQA